MTKKLSYKGLKKKCWKLMSEYVRKRDKRCFTCGVFKPFKELEAGHYIHKNCLDYDFININAQCTTCNRWKHGNLGIYGEKLIKKYGLKKIEALRRKGNQVKRFSIKELEDILQDIKQKLTK